MFVAKTRHFRKCKEKVAILTPYIVIIVYDINFTVVNVIYIYLHLDQVEMQDSVNL